MRVLHIGKYYPPFSGGIENFMAELLPRLEKRGVQVSAIVHDHQRGRGSANDMVDGVPILRVRTHGQLLYAPLAPAFPYHLGRVLRRFRPDLLHLHVPNTSAFWPLLDPRARRIPSVVHWHSDVAGSEFDRRIARAYPLYRPWERALLRRCSRVILTSPPYLEASPALSPWHSKCTVIPYGLDAERLAQPDERALREAGERWWGRTTSLRVLAIGRLAYFKGHSVLVRAAANIPGRIVIAGEGPMRGSLERLIGDLGVADRVTLAGDVRGAALHALLCTCDCLALPSIERTESFGIVLIEAMRYGKPVVASAIPGSGVGWVARDGETALLVPPGQPDALAGALSVFAADAGLRERFGEAGRRRFFEHFLIDPAVDRIQQLYAEVLAQRRAT